MTALSFQPELLAKVLAGTKTQTRRVVKPGEQLWAQRDSRFNGGVFTAKRRAKWREGHTVAVIPGRGKHAVGRVLIKEIREDLNVRNISVEDVQAEGFLTREMFLATWIALNDPQLERKISRSIPVERRHDRGFVAQEVLDAIINDLPNRPDEFYRAWAITFELVKE
jgi:hypothetical protein